MPLDLSKAQEAKPTPDIITYNNSVIDACEKSGDIEKSGAAEKKSGDEKKASPSIGRKRKRSDSSSSCTSSSCTSNDWDNLEFIGNDGWD